ncbi:MAG TPA: glycogen/starch/alpha-glucan phosphorylase [Planctomycetota bacterium]|jgi:starch phosphorylase
MDELSQTSIIPGMHTRTGVSPETLARAIQDNLYYVQGRVPKLATKQDWYMAVAYTVRDRMLQRWVKSVETSIAHHARLVCYLSAEFLLGPHLGNNILNLGITDAVRQATTKLGLNLDELLALEEEPGLGNGGLGRLAACYMDSLATLEVPAIGYGIRYEFGIFDQVIKDGWQVEITDKWLRAGNPWEIARPERTFDVKFGGHTRQWKDDSGRLRVDWIPDQVIRGVPCDTGISGFRKGTVNLLRLWRAEACESFDFQAFNQGDYYHAVEAKVASETLSKVLYPNDEAMQGKRLRLAQQHFFVSCSLQDMIRIQLTNGRKLEDFHQKFAVQLNDTHPSIGVAELMRLLIDEHQMEWEKAWNVTRNTFAYTNHTLLPEALEKWSIPLFGSMLPRHLEIIYEINRRFLGEVEKRFPDDVGRMQRLSLIDENGERYVRMAHLACVGSHKINGVAALHSELLKTDVLRDFNELYPEKFLNVTNGVTPRRWIALANPELAALITQVLGDGWLGRLETDLVGLERMAEDPSFQEQWRQIKRNNKVRLAGIMKERTGVMIDPDSLFDVQVKRIHEYKRQHLNILHVIALYNQLRQHPQLSITPRTVIFGGKAAPGYYMAKLIIKLINSVAGVVNRDPALKDRLRVVFAPDFNVTNAQPIYPAADLSEQISTAGKEASGTGNMKFSMNGALTIGTLDGANVEIRERVGQENFFLFGLTTPQVAETWARGYQPQDFLGRSSELKAALELISNGHFSNGDRELFKPLVDQLVQRDPFLVLADFDAYLAAQRQVGEAYTNTQRWTAMSILNVARMGYFSSDRSVREYCEKIWNTQPLPVEM